MNEPTDRSARSALADLRRIASTSRLVVVGCIALILVSVPLGALGAALPAFIAGAGGVTFGALYAISWRRAAIATRLLATVRRGPCGPSVGADLQTAATTPCSWRPRPTDRRLSFGFRFGVTWNARRLRGSTGSSSRRYSAASRSWVRKVSLRPAEWSHGEVQQRSGADSTASRACGSSVRQRTGCLPAGSDDAATMQMRQGRTRVRCRRGRGLGQAWGNPRGHGGLRMSFSILFA